MECRKLFSDRARFQFRILREKGTEMPGTGEYDKKFEEGVYTCAGCGTPLYKSTTKFDVCDAFQHIFLCPNHCCSQSGCGWPAFFDGM